MTDAGSSIAAVHRLLAALASAKPDGRFAEMGTAFGAGARAIVEAMGPDATLVTVEVDSDRYKHAAAELASTRAEVLHGRWQDVLPQRGPFDLIFQDGDIRSEGALELSISLLAPGGVLVKDDMSPGRPIDGDPIREGLLRDPRLTSVEIMTTAKTAAIIAVRRA